VLAQYGICTHSIFGNSGNFTLRSNQHNRIFLQISIKNNKTARFSCSFSDLTDSFDTLRSEETQILASVRPKPNPNGHCQDTSTRSNLLPCDTGIAATCSFRCFPSPSLCQFGTLLILPLLARLVVSQLVFGSSLRGFRRTRMIRRVDGDSYSRFNSIKRLTAAKAAMSLFHPDLKDRGYQALVIYVF